jgi:acyl dehydratase
VNSQELTFADVKKMVGEELGVSSWVEVDQTMIDRFADTTRDRQWIHVDVERAQKESPYGTTVAHGFLTLSLLPGLSYETNVVPKGISTWINYGLDKVRFVAPVRVGSKVRLRSTLIGLDERSPGQFQMHTKCVIEIDGEEKPALVADMLLLLIAEPDA